MASFLALVRCLPIAVVLAAAETGPACPLPRHAEAVGHELEGGALGLLQSKSSKIMKNAPVDGRPVFKKQGAQVSLLESGVRVVIVRAGFILGRYQLLEQIVDSSSRHPLALLHGDDKWPEGFEGLGKVFGDVSHLGKGGQGEVWKARDLKSNSYVAVKIFLTKTADGYLTWADADDEEKERLRKAERECGVMQRVQDQAREDPIGATHVLRCFENNVEPKEGSTLPSHIVLELGGPSLDKWVEKHTAWRRAKHGDLSKVREIVAKILLAFRLLQSMTPPVIHHDMKPANVMAFMRDGELLVKVFDFGLAINGTEEDRKQRSDGTWLYTPRENLQIIPIGSKPLAIPSMNVSFEFPAWSYDVFGVGAVYLEMICPQQSSLSSLKKPRTDIYGELAKPYKKGLVDRIINQAVGDDGQGLCPEIHSDEVALIESMVGPYDKRPSPAELLNNPILSGFAKQ